MRAKLLLSLLISLGVLVSQAQPPKPIPGQYIVILKESSATPVIKQETRNTNRLQKASDNEAKAVNAYLKLKGAKQGDIKGEYVYAVVGFTAILTPDELAKVKANPDVQGVYQDCEIKPAPAAHEINPPDVQINFQYTPCPVTTAGGSADGSAKSTWIWFIGSGIDGSHPDLNVQTGSPFAISFVQGENWNDNSGLSTHCAGIAAAKNNNSGIIGVSAGARVVPVKILDSSGLTTWNAVVTALNHIAMHSIPGDVICITLGGREGPDCYNCNQAVRDAINNLANAGIWVVLSAGNDSSDGRGYCPGCTSGTRVYTVGSITCAKAASSFSNFSPAVVDWVAVGEDVYSTLPGGRYGTLSGTEMAVPVVAGIIHSKGAPPVSGGVVNCRGTDYRIAHR